MAEFKDNEFFITGESYAGQCVIPDETVKILLHPPLPVVGVSIAMD